MDQVSEAVNIPKSTISGYENDHREPPPDKLKILAAFFDTSSDFLLGLTEDIHSSKVTHDAERYLSREDLHWNGVPLSQKELSLVRELISTLVENRINARENC